MWGIRRNNPLRRILLPALYRHSSANCSRPSCRSSRKPTRCPLRSTSRRSDSRRALKAVGAHVVAPSFTHLYLPMCEGGRPFRRDRASDRGDGPPRARLDVHPTLRPARSANAAPMGSDAPPGDRRPSAVRRREPPPSLLFLRGGGGRGGGTKRGSTHPRPHEGAGPHRAGTRRRRSSAPPQGRGGPLLLLDPPPSRPPASPTRAPQPPRTSQRKAASRWVPVPPTGSPSPR